MADIWKTVFKDTVEGRSVEGLLYDEGGYRVKTTQLDDQTGSVKHYDEKTVAIFPPTAAGSPIELEADTLSELLKDLIDAGFSAAGAALIIYTFPS